MLKVGIIGAGLVGEKRARHLAGARLVAVCDRIGERAKKLALAHKAAIDPDWGSLIQREEIDAVCVCTPHADLARCAAAALKAGKHVLVEKPGGRNPQEFKSVIDVSRESRKILRVGFNHRFHPAFQEAKRILQGSGIGPLMYFRARYGHGGRLGYEREWRADRAQGGGELLDQGVHLIDLCRWLGGEFNLEWGRAKTYFWPMDVEDNAFVFLESPDQKRSAFLHASWTEWKNLFNFEIFGRDGKMEITGLGHSYGTEELRIYRMKPEMGPPDVETIPFLGEDTSWQAEFEAFTREIQGQPSDIGTPVDALRTLEIVAEVYRQSNVADKA